MDFSELYLNLIFNNVKRGITISPSLDPFSLRSQVNNLFSDLSCRAIAFRIPFSEDLVFIGDDPYSKKEIVKILNSGSESLFVIGESMSSIPILMVDSFFTMNTFEPVLEQEKMDSFIEYYFFPLLLCRSFSIGTSVFPVDLTSIMLKLIGVGIRIRFYVEC